jgi:hypothetical protein
VINGSASKNQYNMYTAGTGSGCPKSDFIDRISARFAAEYADMQHDTRNAASGGSLLSRRVPPITHRKKPVKQTPMVLKAVMSKSGRGSFILIPPK